MKRGSLAITVTLPLAVVVLTPRTAEAFEHQHQLGIDGGLTFISIDQTPSVSFGAGGGLHYSYGLSDAFDLLVEGAISGIALQGLPMGTMPTNNRATVIENLGVGIGYTLDVLRWVPYFGVLGSAFSLHGGTVDDVRFAGGVTVAAGIDYHLSGGPKHFAVGLAVRQHFLLSDLVNYPSYTQVFLRAEYVWGF